MNTKTISQAHVALGFCRSKKIIATAKRMLIINKLPKTIEEIAIGTP